MGIDALTVDWWYDLQPRGWGCDCPAKDKEFAQHAEWCAVTPIYADIVHKHNGIGPYNIVKPINEANFATTQTAIKCAQCGATRLGRDLDVIYQAVLNNGLVPSNLRYPANIVKAVCPEHNRKGTVGLLYERS